MITAVLTVILLSIFFFLQDIFSIEMFLYPFVFLNF